MTAPTHTPTEITVEDLQDKVDELGTVLFEILVAAGMSPFADVHAIPAEVARLYRRAQLAPVTNPARQVVIDRLRAWATGNVDDTDVQGIARDVRTILDWPTNQALHGPAADPDRRCGCTHPVNVHDAGRCSHRPCGCRKVH